MLGRTGHYDAVAMFERGDHKVILGNAVEALEMHVPDSAVDLIFAEAFI